ncbi:MAG: LapA family protein [Betaproteobacteria bacterium]
MQVLRWIVGATLFLALLFLSLQNSELVTLKFYHWWSWQAPLIFIVLIAFAIGVAAGLLAGAMRAARLKRQLNRLRRDHRHETPAAAPDWSKAGSLPGAAPASGPGYVRGDGPVDGV